MRFKQFIQEEKNFDLEKFKSDCEFYFNEMRDADLSTNFLFHGDKNAPSDFIIKQFKERGGPRDTNKEIHNSINIIFDDKFGFPFRNGLFVTGRSSDTNAYGKQTIIFPIGKFDWLSNLSEEFRDMTELQEKIHIEVWSKIKWSQDRTSNQKIEADMFAEIHDKVVDKVSQSKYWKHNEDLLECIHNKSEIMIKCKQYYEFTLDGDTFNDVVKPFLKSL